MNLRHVELLNDRFVEIPDSIELWLRVRDSCVGLFGRGLAALSCNLLTFRGYGLGLCVRVREENDRRRNVVIIVCACVDGGIQTLYYVCHTIFSFPFRLHV